MQEQSLEAQKVVDMARAFLDVAKQHKGEPYSITRLTDLLTKSPAPRFYISFHRAYIFVSMIHRGKELPIMSSNKREMYKELYRRYSEHLKSHPEEEGHYTSLKQIIEEPAPSFYVSSRTFLNVIYKKFKSRVS